MYIFQKSSFFLISWTLNFSHLKTLKTEYVYNYVVSLNKEWVKQRGKLQQTVAVTILHHVTTTTTFRENIVVVFREKDSKNCTNINMWEEKIQTSAYCVSDSAAVTNMMCCAW